jgi:hypothetical protein
MTRETKIGLLVTVSFLLLVGIVLYSKMTTNKRLSEDDGQAEVTIPPEPTPSTGDGKGSSGGPEAGEPHKLPEPIKTASFTGPSPEARPLQTLPGLPSLPGVKDKESPALTSASTGGTGRSTESSQKSPPWMVPSSGQTLPPAPIPAGEEGSSGGTSVATVGLPPVPPALIPGDKKKTTPLPSGSASEQGASGATLPGPLTGQGTGAGAKLTGVDTASTAGKTTGVDAAGTAGKITMPEPPPLIGAQPDKKLETAGSLPAVPTLVGVQDAKDQTGGKTSAAAVPGPLPSAIPDARVDLGKPKPSAPASLTGDTAATKSASQPSALEVQGLDTGAYGAKTHQLPPLGTPAGAVAPPITASLPPAAGRTTPAAPQVESYDEETYRLRPGDSLQAVSQRFYHTDKYAQALLRFNRDHPLADRGLKTDPITLQPDQAIYLPPTEILEKRYAGLIPDLGTTAGALSGREARSSPVAAGVAQASAVGPKTISYTVKPGGEKMWDIASRALGKGERWTQIRDLNGGYDPQFPVPAGTVLQLPADARP